MNPGVHSDSHRLHSILGSRGSGNSLNLDFAVDDDGAYPGRNSASNFGRRLVVTV